MNNKNFTQGIVVRMARQAVPKYAGEAAASKPKKPAKKKVNAKGLRERNGHWFYRIKWEGREIAGDTGLLAAPANINDAIAIRQRKVNELKAGAEEAERERVEIAVEQAVRKYLDWYKGEHRNKRKTQEWAQAALSSFAFYFQGRMVSRLTPGEVELYKSWRRENGIKENSIRHNLTAMNGFFKFGRKQGWLEHDPLEEVAMPSNKRSSEMHVLSPEEEAIYHAAAGQRSDVLADIFRVMIDQGCRPGEVMALEQRSIDLAKRKFRINDGKSDAARRTLRMTDAVHAIFERRLATPHRWVFPGESAEGRTMTLQKAHEWVVRKTGLVCVIYDFRHTFATRMAVAGCPLPILAMLIGHSDMNLLHVYVHPAQDDMDRAMGAYSKSQNYSEMLVMDADSDWQKVAQKSGPGPLSALKQAETRGESGKKEARKAS